MRRFWPILLAVLWLMGAMGTYWWFYVWLFWMGFNLLVLLLYPTVIAPIFNKFSPLEDDSLKTRIEGLLKRCGFTSADDRLPVRFLEPLKTGPFADKPLTEEQIRKVVTDYYTAHGWDEQTGTPKPETLEKLGIAEYATA